MSYQNFPNKRSSTYNDNDSNQYMIEQTNYMNYAMDNQMPVTMARLDFVPPRLNYSYGGPMPNMISNSNQTIRENTNFASQINHSHVVGNTSSGSLKKVVSHKFINLGVGSYNSSNTVTMEGRNSISKMPSLNEEDANKNPHRKSSLEFMPYKTELVEMESLPFRHIIQDTMKDPVVKNKNKESSKINEIPTEPAKKKKSKSKKRHQQSQSAQPIVEEQITTDKINKVREESISTDKSSKNKQPKETREENNPEKTNKNNKLVQRAIERSKNDMGILKYRDDIPPLNLPNDLSEIKKPDSSNTFSAEEKTFIPKKVTKLHNSDLEIPEDSSHVKSFQKSHLENGGETSKHRFKLSKKISKRPTPSDENPSVVDETNNSTKKSKKPRLASNSADDQQTDKSHYSIQPPNVDLLQCSFVDGLKGRCKNTNQNVYCEGHEKIIREIEGAFENLDEDLHLNRKQDSIIHHSKERISSSRRRHGLTTENKDIILRSLQKLKLLDAQEESFNNKIRAVHTQIQSLNKLRCNFDKQRRALCDEKNRVVDNLLTLVNSWSPLFHDVDNPSVENTDLVTSNQKVITNLLFRLNQTIDDDTQ